MNRALPIVVSSRKFVALAQQRRLRRWHTQRRRWRGLETSLIIKPSSRGKNGKYRLKAKFQEGGDPADHKNAGSCLRCYSRLLLGARACFQMETRPLQHLTDRSHITSEITPYFRFHMRALIAGVYIRIMTLTFAHNKTGDVFIWLYVNICAIFLIYMEIPSFLKTNFNVIVIIYYISITSAHYL